MLHPDFGGDAKRILNALKGQFLYIELTPEGTILTANDLFCARVERELAALKGRHHSALVDPVVAKSPERQGFLARIARGERFSYESMRVDEGGREKWLATYYNPVVGPNGALRKVVGVALDVTAAKARAVEDSCTLKAISRAQAIAEFSPDGTVLAANENFRKALGYRLEEVHGQNHRMFVEPAYAQSAERQPRRDLRVQRWRASP